MLIESNQFEYDHYDVTHFWRCRFHDTIFNVVFNIKECGIFLSCSTLLVVFVRALSTVFLCFHEVAFRSALR